MISIRENQSRSDDITALKPAQVGKYHCVKTHPGRIMSRRDNPSRSDDINTENPSRSDNITAWKTHPDRIHSSASLSTKNNFDIAGKDLDERIGTFWYGSQRFGGLLSPIHTYPPIYPIPPPPRNSPASHFALTRCYSTVFNWIKMYVAAKHDSQEHAKRKDLQVHPL